MAYGVEDDKYEYHHKIEEREEGGTPDIIGSVRAAFAFMIKNRLTSQFIMEREERFLKLFLFKTNFRNYIIPLSMLVYIDYTHFYNTVGKRLSVCR